MQFNEGDIVTRNSHNNDIYFKIISIKDDVVLLKGVELRLYADSNIDDLKKETFDIDFYQSDRLIVEKNKKKIIDDRGEYFYIPGKILHIDGDNEYLSRCMNYYKEMGVKAYGFKIEEEDVVQEINQLLIKYQPDIVVITGHDSYNKKKHLNYQNSDNFAQAVRRAREWEKSQDKLIVIAGACQSNYEELIKAGSNFASSPKRINIHALDPAIIASSVALSSRNEPIDLMELIERTKYGSNGIGGIITSGTMYTGYPR